MYLLYCDETNLERRDNEFFVYGGLLIEGNVAAQLSAAVEAIRGRADVAPDFSLKFNPGPPHLDHLGFAAVKQQIIEAAIATNCLLFATVILHNIATDADTARRNAINQLSYNFNAFLEQQRDHGLVLIDRFSDNQIDSHLRTKFSVGVIGLPYTPRLRLTRIIGFHYSAIGQSHFGSIIDVILGTLRFSINALCRDEAGKTQRARQFLTMLAPLFQKTTFAGEHGPWVTELSLDFTPKTIKSDAYRARYDQLRNFLAESGIIAAQDIK